MDFASLHEQLRSTYDEMMPLCAQMTGSEKALRDWAHSFILLFGYELLLPVPRR